MARSKHRNYKSDYTRLFDNPAALFGPGAEVILWPNGSPEIWIRGPGGDVYKIRAGVGPVGFALTVNAPRGCDVFPDVGTEHTTTRTFSETPGDMTMLDSCHELEICQYRPDDRSQAFRAWYRGEGSYPVGDRPGLKVSTSVPGRPFGGTNSFGPRAIILPREPATGYDPMTDGRFTLVDWLEYSHDLNAGSEYRPIGAAETCRCGL